MVSQTCVCGGGGTRLFLLDVKEDDADSSNSESSVVFVGSYEALLEVKLKSHPTNYSQLVATCVHLLNTTSTLICIKIIPTVPCILIDHVSYQVCIYDCVMDISLPVLLAHPEELL